MTHPAISAGNIAIVTGAALGIGRALARYFADMGMKVALLDVDADLLREAADAVSGETESIPCDVSDMAALERARDRVAERWGKAPAVLVNNAVTRAGRGLDAPLEEWRRALDVNILGVVHGVRAFLPGMKASGAPGLIINLGSKQGITNPPGHPVYNMSKAAIRAYTEALEHDLRQDPDQKISAHLLVPGWTTTGTSEHRPGAWLPEQVVGFMLDKLAQGQFYIICPDDEVSEAQDRARIAWGAGDITEGRPPLSRWHADWSDVFKKDEPR